MSSISTSTSVGGIPRVYAFGVDLAHDAGSYAFAMANEECFIESIAIYCTQAAAGLTSITIDSDDTVPVAILGATVAASITEGTQIGAYVTPFILQYEHSLRVNITGNGSAGALRIMVTCSLVADSQVDPPLSSVSTP